MIFTSSLRQLFRPLAEASDTFVPPVYAGSLYRNKRRAARDAQRSMPLMRARQKDYDDDTRLFHFI